MLDNTLFTLHANICKALANPIRIEGLNAYFRLSTHKIGTACRVLREVLIENLRKQGELISHL